MVSSSSFCPWPQLELVSYVINLGVCVSHITWMVLSLMMLIYMVSTEEEVHCSVEAVVGDCGGNDSGNHGVQADVNACREICRVTDGCQYYGMGSTPPRPRVVLARSCTQPPLHAHT